MALVAATPMPHPGFQPDYPYESSYSRSYSQRSLPDSGAPVSLPSIRMAFPELDLPSKPQDPSIAIRSTETSPLSAAHGTSTSPGYTHSPVTNKRRRPEEEDELERDRARQIPRAYRSPSYSPTQQAPSDAWAQRSPYVSRAHVPPPMEIQDRVEPRLPLPSFPPSMSTERNAAPKPRSMDHHHEEYVGHRSPQARQAPPPAWDAAPRYPVTPTYEYPPYHHHTAQMHSHSATHPHSYDHSPLSAGGYPRQYTDSYGRYGDMGHIAIAGDGKQRKRRGNLPKETTDKLRNWFVTHLQHPYPTEDEKQELMRETGLQMNQISNWFINARRRQLPAMISNARVESEAMNGRASEGKILPTTERSDFSSHHGMTLSDGEGGAYDEELDGYGRHRGPAHQRGSV